MEHAASLFDITIFGLLVVSLQASLLFGVLFTARVIFLACRQRRFTYVIWLILFLRLSVPLSIETGFSPYRIFPFEKTFTQALFRKGENDTTRSLPDTSPYISPAPAKNMPDGYVPGSQLKEHSPAAFSLSFPLGMVWLAGVLFFCSRIVIIHRKHRRRLTSCTPIIDPGIVAIFRRVMIRVGLKRRVTLLQTDEKVMPYAYGLLHPVVVIPRTLCQHLSIREWECVLTHELMHIKRYDLWIQTAAVLLSAVYWFNPLVWVAGRLLKRDSEISCDAATLALLGSDWTSRYQDTIVHILEINNCTHFPQCALGIIGKHHHLLRRLILIHSWKPKSSRWQIAGVVFLFCASFLFCTRTAGADDGIIREKDHSVLFRAPVTASRVTAEYGWRVNPLTKQPAFHNGIDMAVPVGTHVTAASDGVVWKINKNADNAYGNYIVVRHANGFSTFYTKLSNILVSENQTVATGQLIGHSGNSGISTGPHIHFMLLQSGTPVNPREYILF